MKFFSLNRGEHRINNCKMKDKWKTNKVLYVLSIHVAQDLRNYIIVII
jgi:hypothetical protein